MTAKRLVKRALKQQFLSARPTSSSSTRGCVWALTLHAGCAAAQAVGDAAGETAEQARAAVSSVAEVVARRAQEALARAQRPDAGGADADKKAG